MAKKLTQEEFIERAQKIHIDEDGNPEYDYSLVKYINCDTKVKIICHKECHGEFLQTPDVHLRERGCPECGGSNKLTTEEFIERAEKIHINKNGEPKYDYSLVEYINLNSNVKIICKEHGMFEQPPSSHIHAESGCKECGIETALLSQTDTIEKFIEKATQIHGDKYDYSKVIYVKAKEKVIIICEACRLENGCGEFLQKPSKHSFGQGCPYCKESKGEKKVKNFLENNNFKYTHQHKFDDCKNKQKLPFDFYLPDFNLCVEYDGELHYKPIEYYGGEETLKKTKFNDQIKNEYCKNNNIPLLRIPYWDFKNIEEILQKELSLELITNSL